MQLGISSHAYGWAVGVPGYPAPHPLSALGLLKRAGDLGVRVVQVADNLPLHTLSGESLDALAGQAAHLGIAIEIGTRGIEPRHILTYLGLAERLRATILRTIVDTPDHRPDEHEIVRTISGLLPDLERAGVCLALENHDRLKVRTMARILRRVDSPHVGVCLDTVNSFGALEGPEVVVETLGPWTVNLHLKDFVVRREGHMMGFLIEGQPLGKGRLDVDWLLGMLREQGRNPNAILEQWTPYDETIEATIAREAAWVAESVAYARRYIPG